MPKLPKYVEALVVGSEESVATTAGSADWLRQRSGTWVAMVSATPDPGCNGCCQELGVGRCKLLRTLA